MSVDPDRVRLGELIEASHVRLKVAAIDLLELSLAYTREGCATHVAPLRAAHGYVKDALRAFDQAVASASKELAADFERQLGEPKES